MALTVNGCCCVSLRTAVSLQRVFCFLLIFIGLRTYFDYFLVIVDNEKKGFIYDILIRNKYYAITYWIIALLELFTTVCTEVGIKANNDYLLLPSLILRAFWILAIIAGSVLFLILSSVLSTSSLILTISVVLPIIGLLFWYWIVIYSLYKELGDRYYREMERAYLTEI